MDAKLIDALETLIRENLDLHHPEWRFEELSDETGEGAVLHLSNVKGEEVSVYPVDNKLELNFMEAVSTDEWQVEADASWIGIYYLLMSYRRVTPVSWKYDQE